MSYTEEKLPGFLDDTEEEYELIMMKETGMKIDEILLLPVSKITICRLIKTKEAFVNYLVNKSEETT
ncbi:MAG: hypothetical protein DCC60_09470 [Ignavibacteriae bacterium]|nr:MAG: hypothetical protein DCC60_09470 [Ignavibacteriota bacterium]